MLTNAHMTTILPVKDMDRARRFYAERLGLMAEGAHADGSFTMRGLTEVNTRTGDAVDDCILSACVRRGWACSLWPPGRAQERRGRQLRA